MYEFTVVKIHSLLDTCMAVFSLSEVSGVSEREILQKPFVNCVIWGMYFKLKKIYYLLNRINEIKWFICLLLLSFIILTSTFTDK